MADVAIPWQLANTSRDPIAAGQQGAAFGLEFGQKQAALSALRGLDMSDGPSLDRTIEGLTRAGALDQANALSNLAFTRSIRTSLPSFQATLAQAMGGGAPTAPATNAAPAPAGGAPGGGITVGEGDADFDHAHAAETMNMAGAAVDRLLNVPPEHRAEEFAAIKKDMTDRGVPEEAIDSVAGDLSDAHLAEMKDYFGQHAAHFGGMGQAPAAGAAPPQAPGLHDATTGWAQNLLNNPTAIAMLHQMKAGGYDLTGLIDDATKLAEPGIAAAAQAQYAGPTRLAQNEADLQTMPTRLGIEAAGAGARVGAEKGAELPFSGPIAAATAAGTAAGSAGAHIVEVKLPDGSTQQGTFAPGPNGTYSFQPIQGAGGGTTGGTGGGLGRSITPGAQAAAGVEGTKLAEQATAMTARAADVPTRKAALQNIRSLAGEFTSGPQSGFWKGIGALAVEYGVPPIGPVPKANAVAAQEELDKLSIGILAAQRQAMGLPATDASSAMTAGAVPNERLTPNGIKRVTGMMMGNEDYIALQSRAWQQWRETHGPETLVTFQNQFNQGWNPIVFQAQYMTPEQKARARTQVGPARFNAMEKHAKALGLIGGR